MLCPHCGKENVSAFGYCAACQKPLSMVEGFAPQTSSAPKVTGIPAKIVFVLTVLLALLVAVTKPVEPGAASKEAGEHFGALLAMVGLPLLIAFLVAGREQVRNLNRFVLVFCLISGLLILSNAASMLSLEAPQERFARLLREAAGIQPVRHKGSPSQRKFDDAVRQQYGKLLQRNRDYTAEVKKLGNSEVKYINTAKAFASEKVARPGLEQLHALWEADARHEQDVKETLLGLRHIFEEVSSRPEREAMLKGFDESLAAQLDRRRQGLAAEKAWIDAVDDEHAYARAHRASFRVVQDKLVIDNLAIRSQFNAKLHFQEEKRQAFLRAQAEYNKSQAESLHKMGLSEKDVRGK